MAGVAYPGVLAAAGFWPQETAVDFPPGTGPNNNGIPTIFVQWTQNPPIVGVHQGGRSPNISDWFQIYTATRAGGTVTPDQQGTPAARNNVAWPASGQQDEATFNAQDWFEQIHILPKTKIEFGNIVTLIDEDYEIYNAFRATSSTENAITNNAAPGVETPNNSPPEILGALTSLLDPSTTGQDLLGLGTLVKLTVNALANGLPNFDTSIVFEFTPPANDVVLLVSGSRIVLVPFGSTEEGFGGYEKGAKETLAFLTEVIPALDGNEQRIALRKNPRQTFAVEFALEGEDRQALHAMLFGWQTQTFGFPVWHERVFLTSPTAIGATQYPVAGADEVDFRVGGLAAAITDRGTFDVIQITAATDTLITGDSPSLNAYPIGTPIVPVRIAIIPQRVDTSRLLNTLETFRIVFEVTDNDTGAPTGDVAPGFWSTYNGRVLFDDCNVLDSAAMKTTLTRRIYRADNQTGVIEQATIWDRNKRASEKGFLARNREEIYALRKLFIGLRGRQKAFYIPTFIEEITPNAQLSIGLDTMDIANIGYVRFVQDRLPMSLFRITFTDGTSLIREVLSSAEVSSTTERLTLDTTWPATRQVSEVERIEWYELARFDSDKMVLTYPRIGQAVTRMPVVRLFDDNA
jgi:hypothetical protein